MIAAAAANVPLAATLSAPRLLTVLAMETLFLGGASLSTLSLLGGLLVLELVLPRRLWCRALCPVGTVLKLLRMPRTLDVRWKAATCDPAACGTHCVATCPWGIDPRRARLLDGCTNCGRCVEGCPSLPSPSLSLGFARGDAIAKTRPGER
jgi:ferredoxin-type protein NapH